MSTFGDEFADYVPPSGEAPKHRRMSAQPVDEILAEIASRIDGSADKDGDVFRLIPLDWEQLKRDGLPEVEYLMEPYIPRGGRVWAVGATESAKSMWALVNACELSREGLHVTYISMENPLVEDVRRLDRLNPDWANFTFIHFEQQDGVYDLIDPKHVDELVRIAEGQDLVLLDTFTACWSGDENDNKSVVAFDRDVARRVVAVTGATLMVIDHTGHAQPFTSRQGASSARGASAKGQKTDSFLQFKAKGDANSHTFEIIHGKGRIGGVTAATALFKVVDTDDGKLAVRRGGLADVDAIKAKADEIVEAIETAGFLTAGQIGEVGGRDETVNDAKRLLRGEDPPRVSIKREKLALPDKNGRVSNRSCDVWRIANPSDEAPDTLELA